jgi:Family of unknown function (DUF6519)
MSGDYSRISFDPNLDFAGVLLQQGRVHLDSDWNELVAQIGRRVQAGTVDILGRAVVPKETKDGFKIQAIGGKLMIGPGRIYVDGLLAENHGATPAAWNPALAEQSGTGSIDYEKQPYVKKVTALPGGGPHLVYLDVWQREVTQLQEPAIVEPAVGVDTSLRLQTVWQVKLLPKLAAGIDCSTPFDKIPNWPHEPSAGRLTTDTGGPTSGTDPCLVPIAAGYKGLENQLYRVEIHDGGVSGKATFKWSRENASIITRVTAIPVLDQLHVESVGRDPGLRFSDGDWIEITDDWRELNNEPGVLRRIKAAGGVDVPARTIFLETSLPAGVFPTDAQGNTDSGRHTRIRRWDQSGIVRDIGGGVFHNVTTGDGSIPVPPETTTLVLEHGITVNFSLQSKTGEFHPGDYWVFTARTATASIEKLAKAPPRGIHHHYCKLAIVTFPDGETDCRVLWPPDDGCACTVCVSPAEHQAGAPSLQMAVDKVVAAGGGTICLDIGSYPLKEPVRIRKAHSLRIVGKGSATELKAALGAIEISDNSTDIALERFDIQAGGSAADGAAVIVQSSAQVRLERLQIQVDSGAWAAIGLGGALAGVTIRENAIKAGVGIIGLPDKPVGAIGLMDLRIEDNQFVCGSTAIQLTNVIVHQHVSRIAANRVTGCEKPAFELTGAIVPGFGLEIIGNELQVLGDGVVVGLDGVRVLNNDLTRMKPSPNKQRAIVLVKGMGGDRGGDAHIAGNRILGFGIGIMSESALGAVSIERNRIADADVGLFVPSTRIENLSIDGNQITNVIENAIFVEGVDGRVAARGNQIEILIGSPGVRIMCQRGDCVYSENQSQHLKPPGKEGVLLTARTLVVSSNRVAGRVITHLQPEKLLCTILGNITGGEILVNGTPLSAITAVMWANFNLQNVP